MARYLFEYASAAKSPAKMSCLVLQLLVRFGVSKQLFALSEMMTDAPTDIDGVFAFKRQNFAKERFYSVVHSPPPTLAGLACELRLAQSSRNFAALAAMRLASSLLSNLAAGPPPIHWFTPHNRSCREILSVLPI
jgi:hypothetical protein